MTIKGFSKYDPILHLTREDLEAAMRGEDLGRDKYGYLTRTSSPSCVSGDRWRIVSGELQRVEVVGDPN